MPSGAGLWREKKEGKKIHVKKPHPTIFGLANGECYTNRGLVKKKKKHVKKKTRTIFGLGNGECYAVRGLVLEPVKIAKTVVNVLNDRRLQSDRLINYKNVKKTPNNFLVFSTRESWFFFNFFLGKKLRFFFPPPFPLLGPVRKRCVPQGNPQGLFWTKYCVQVWGKAWFAGERPLLRTAVLPLQSEHLLHADQSRSSHCSMTSRVVSESGEKLRFFLKNRGDKMPVFFAFFADFFFHSLAHVSGFPGPPTTRWNPKLQALQVLSFAVVHITEEKHWAIEVHPKASCQGSKIWKFQKNSENLKLRKKLHVIGFPKENRFFIFFWKKPRIFHSFFFKKI